MLIEKENPVCAYVCNMIRIQKNVWQEDSSFLISVAWKQPLTSESLYIYFWNSYKEKKQ